MAIFLQRFDTDFAPRAFNFRNLGIKFSSKIVAYYGLQAAANFAEVDDALLEDLIPRLRKLNARGAKSVSNRCRKIAKQLEIELYEPPRVS
ncbi:MAG: hypothetical protein ACKO27_04175 [Ilumatobacteraceae bacterium]